MSKKAAEKFSKGDLVCSTKEGNYILDSREGLKYNGVVVET